jgi:hypothetical protein
MQQANLSRGKDLPRQHMHVFKEDMRERGSAVIYTLSYLAGGSMRLPAQDGIMCIQNLVLRVTNGQGKMLGLSMVRLGATINTLDNTCQIAVG